MRRSRGFTLIEMMVATGVAAVTSVAVTAVFLNYNQTAYAQAGIRAAQGSLRQGHQLVARNLRMAGYGLEPPFAFDMPAGWQDDAGRNRSDRLVFRMRNPRFSVPLSSATATSLTLGQPPPERLRRGQIVQAVCPGAMAVTYGQLAADAEVGDTQLSLEGATGSFPRLNELTMPCFGAAGGFVFKVDVFDYSIQLIDDDGVASTPTRPYLFRRHGLAENDPNALGEPVAEDIEALRVTFLRANGTAFVPDTADTAPDYDTPADDARRLNNHPANIRAVRIGMVARSAMRDMEAMRQNLLDTIPGFALRPDLVGPAGYRRTLYETTVQVHNLRSIEMFVPNFTQDTTTTNVCQGAAPSDGLNCAGG